MQGRKCEDLKDKDEKKKIKENHSLPKMTIAGATIKRGVRRTTLNCMLAERDEIMAMASESIITPADEEDEGKKDTFLLSQDIADDEMPSSMSLSVLPKPRLRPTERLEK